MDISNIYSQYYSSAASSTQAAELKNKLSAAADKNAEDEKLKDACKEFESYLLEQVFKGMEKTIMKDKEDEEDGPTGNLVDYFKGETLKSLCQQSTELSSLGLADMLYQQLKASIGFSAEEIAEKMEVETED